MSVKKVKDSSPPAQSNGQNTNGAAAAHVPLLVLLWFSSLNEIARQDHLVRDLLLAASLFVVFGESNSGKTFWLLDLCLAIAAGGPWRGRIARNGLVIYVAGEGASSVRMRVTAYRAAHPEVSGGLPFAIVPFAVDFLSTDSVSILIDTIRAAESECGEKAVLIVIDTFARSIPGGNENDAQDVGVAVTAADRIRAEIDCCVGFVHHAGKDPTKGARGSSALRAAVDTEILIEAQNNQHSATVTKQRDLMAGQAMPFELVPQAVGHHDDGTDITSCVVKQVDVESQPALAKRNGKHQERFETALKEFKRTHPEDRHISTIDMTALCKAQNIPPKRRREVFDSFVNARVLSPSVGGYTFHGENL
jgi:RecA-family ATPase